MIACTIDIIGANVDLSAARATVADLLSDEQPENRNAITVDIGDVTAAVQRLNAAGYTTDEDEADEALSDEF